MTKLERWLKSFEDECRRRDQGGALLCKRGVIHERDVIHFYGPSGDSTVILCTDGQTLGFHNIGYCPFVAAP